MQRIRPRTSSCSSSSLRLARTARIRSRSSRFARPRRVGPEGQEVQACRAEARRASEGGKEFMKRTIVGIALTLLSLAASGQAQTLNVMATTEDLASIAREVGGDKITIDAIARGYQDPHFVEAKPSFILKLQKADLLLVVGRELEIGWLPPLIQQSRNAKVQVGAQGYLDASQHARILDIPTGQVTRAEGDVHPLGNPHYWLDPENGKRIAKDIADKLSQQRPNDRAAFEQGLAAFSAR